MPQSLADILLHIVFSTKYREPIIIPEIQDELYRYIGTVCRSCGSPSLAVGGIEDHIHIACALSRSIRVCDLVEEIKRTSSKWIKTKDIPNFRWQAGYGVFSFRSSEKGVVVRYIARQKEHHGRKTFCQEYRGLLVQHNVPFDERYMWE